MLILQGGQALSSFRIQSLISRANAAGIALENLTCTYLFFITGVVHDSAKLEQLLDASPLSVDSGLVALPRSGTTSPWSSKATEIAKNCGFEIVKRIERGMHIVVEGQVSAADQILLNRLLADPMMEDVPLWVVIHIRFPDKRKRDIDGPVKPILDLLVRHGCIKDDSRIERLEITKYVPGQWDQDPGTFDVKVQTMEDYNCPF